MLFGLLLQSWLQPYRTQGENRTEEFGFVMLIATFGAQFFATTSTGKPVQHADILFLMLLCFDGLFVVFMLVGTVRAIVNKMKCCQRKTKRGARDREYRRSRTPAKATM